MAKKPTAPPAAQPASESAEPITAPPAVDTPPAVDIAAQQCATIRDALIAKLGLPPAIAERLAGEYDDTDRAEIAAAASSRDDLLRVFNDLTDRHHRRLEAQQAAQQPAQQTDPAGPAAPAVDASSLQPGDDEDDLAKVLR